MVNYDIKFLEIKAEEQDKIAQIMKLEETAFGKNGAVDEWILKPFVRYGKVYVAEKTIDNEIIGVVELVKDWTGEIVYIYGFAVKNNFHRKGVGSFMLENTLKKFDKEKLKKIVLTVGEENIGAINLYEKYNFKREKILKDEYGKGIDRILMEYKYI